MNDRFRFRIWNKETGMYCIHKYVEETSVLFLARLPEERYAIEQSTGLKDENGKLIYEGDIVRVFYDHFDGNFIEKEVVGPVVWECGTWVVNGWFLNSAPEYDETHLESAAVEVIGNIHEHGGLLNEN